VIWFESVKKGQISIEKFKEFDVPTGVKNSYFDKNLKGGKIDLKDKRNVVYVGKYYLSPKQSDRIKKFAKRRET
jgi:hypothetical protein